MTACGNNIPFWLRPQRNQLLENAASLPVALMLLGSIGTGRFKLAMEVAQTVLCHKPIPTGYCCECSSCTMFLSGTHPDFHLITTEKYSLNLDEFLQGYSSRYLQKKEKRSTSRKSGQQIGVDQIRSVIERMSTHSYMGADRVVVIAPGEAMNTNSANALLKILEEPNPGCRFIILCSGRDKLPATIFSRVTIFNVSTPPRSESIEWLRKSGLTETQGNQLVTLSNEAPLLALQYFEEGWSEKISTWEKIVYKVILQKLEPVAAAGLIGIDDSVRFLYWMERVCCDLVSVKQGRDSRYSLLQTDQFAKLLLDMLYSPKLWDMIRRLQQYRYSQQRVIDELLFLEDILIAIWQKKQA